MDGRRDPGWRRPVPAAADGARTRLVRVRRRAHWAASLTKLYLRVVPKWVISSEVSLQGQAFHKAIDWEGGMLQSVMCILLT